MGFINPVVDTDDEDNDIFESERSFSGVWTGLSWIAFLYFKLAKICIKHSSHHMKCLIDANQKKLIWKGKTIVSKYVRSNKTHMTNAVFAKQWQLLGFQNLIKLLNSFDELNSLIFWGTISHIFGLTYRTDWIP